MRLFNLGQGYDLEYRESSTIGSSIRIYHKLNGIDRDMIQFNFTNEENPDESSFQFTDSYEDADHVLEGIFSSTFSDYQMIVHIYEDDEIARIDLIDLNTSKTLCVYHIPTTVARRIIEFGKNNHIITNNSTRNYNENNTNTNQNVTNNSNTESVNTTTSNNPSMNGGFKRNARKSYRKKQNKRRYITRRR